MGGEMKPRAWPLFGYAPGGYMCRCGYCGKQFEGDKRAIRCLECAAIQANASAGRAALQKDTDNG